MDSSIPPGLPAAIAKDLQELNTEFGDGYLTEKGYIKKRQAILSRLQQIDTPVSRSSSDVKSHHRAYSVNSIISDPRQINSGSESLPPSTTVQLKRPLDPRVITELGSSATGSFDTLAAILRHRGSTYQRETAIMMIDSKGKESVSITWEKLYLRAEKVAQQIRDKSGLYKNDRVCLIYQSVEVVEYTIALFGCFLAGVVAVPITLDMKITEMIQIMNLTLSHLCLTSESVMKYLDRKVNDQSKLKWPKGLVFWRTNDFGSYHQQKKQDPPTLQVPDLAYIEFVRSPDGELNGVAISHKTIMQQMNSLVSILTSNPNYDGKPFKRSDISFTRNRNVMLNILDARKSVGLIVGTLLNVYSGNLMIWTPSSLLDIAGLYAHIITKYGVTVLLNDYLSLKQVVYNYQSFPQYTRKFSKREINFSTVKWVLIYTSIVDGEFHEILTNRWLKPLGCKDVENVVSPLLTLSEFGGMVISMRDWIGQEHKLNTTITPMMMDDLDSAPKNESQLSEVLIDKQSLTTNTVKVISDRPPPLTDSYKPQDFLRIGSFGYPLPDATLAVVNPETCYLSGVLEVGEIWIDSMSLPGGFWGAPEGTQNIFHARCRDHEGFLDLEFLRTGLLGFTYNGKVYVLGLYEDRLRQRVTWVDKKDEKSADGVVHYRYHYSDHLAYTLSRAVAHKRVSDSSAFDVLINNEHLPVVVIESPSAVPNASGAVDIPELDLVASKSFTALERYHNVRPFCILILQPESLPRTIKSGIPGIANMLVKRYFLEGVLKSVYVKYNVRKSITEIPRSKYYLDSVWSESVSRLRYDSLSKADDQYSGLDYRDTSVDDRTNKPLTDFDTILDILKWRVKHQADELAFSGVSKQSKALSWRKFDVKVASIVGMILEKARKGKFKAGDTVGLMFTLSDDFVAAIYACWLLGLVVIPLNPVDPNRIKEDIPSLFSIVKDYKVKHLFVNNEVESILKNKPVAPLLRENAPFQLVKIRNTSKLNAKAGLQSFQSSISKFLNGKSLDKSAACLILINYSQDNVRTGVKVTHTNVSAICKIMKETCQLESKNPVMACVRHTSGIGFIQSALIGVYLGSSTYIIPPMDFATNPSSFYMTLARYKVKDIYVTPQMLDYSIRKMNTKDFSLDRLKNLMVGWEGRPNVDLIKNVATKFSVTKLTSSSISHVYSHFYNPMVTLRSYLSLDPVDLWLDPDALRLGLISIVNPSNVPNAIRVQDSGIVPVCTQIAIVNPETGKLCKVGEYGEIWVCSEGNYDGVLQKSGEKVRTFHQYQFGATINGGDDSLSYVRTGDLGFLHNVSRTEKSGTIEFQPLFVLGPISSTFECMGLMHFADDIESSIECSHADIRTGGSCVFKADGFVIAVIDSARARYLSSLVPVIFNKVLSDHFLVLDIVVFTKEDSFPYSRLGIKQRGKIVKMWTEKKLQIHAQYGLNYGEQSLIKTVQDFEAVSEGSSLNTKVADLNLKT